MAAYAHMPGIDVLMNEYSTATDAQFGNARAVREIRSAANQGGRERTMSETYGAGGWDLTFADQKRIGDWEYALGVNFLNQHLSYATIKGARKRDHPLSFSDHEPWWGQYNTLADYFGRLSVAMSLGQQVNKVLVLEPTTTAWMFYSPAAESADFKTVGSDFQAFVHLLEAEHIEYDLVSEKTLQAFGSASHARLNVGARSYGLVVLPPGLRNLEDTTVALVRDYLIRDGKIVSWVAPPDFVNGLPTEDLRELQNSFGDRWLNSGPGNGFDKIRRYSPPVHRVRRPARGSQALPSATGVRRRSARLPGQHGARGRARRDPDPGRRLGRGMGPVHGPAPAVSVRQARRQDRGLVRPAAGGQPASLREGRAGRGAGRPACPGLGRAPGRGGARGAKPWARTS